MVERGLGMLKRYRNLLNLFIESLLISNITPTALTPSTASTSLNFSKKLQPLQPLNFFNLTQLL
jgi:hypothetical protein